MTKKPATFPSINFTWEANLAYWWAVLLPLVHIFKYTDKKPSREHSSGDCRSSHGSCISECSKLCFQNIYYNRAEQTTICIWSLIQFSVICSINGYQVDSLFKPTAISTPLVGRLFQLLTHLLLNLNWVYVWFPLGNNLYYMK